MLALATATDDYGNNTTHSPTSTVPYSDQYRS